MQKIIHAYAIVAAFISFTSYTVPALALPTATVSNIPNNLPVNFVQQPQLPDNGTPTGRRKGAAGRGNCALAQPLTALVPAMEKTLNEGGGKITYVWGKTIAEHPTFWFYVPYSHTSLRSVEFVIQDGENDVYRTPLKLPTMPGVVSFRLPSTAPPLKIGKMYHWFFKIKINCDSQNSSDVKEYVEGWVQRVKLNPNLTSQLKAATQRQRIALYATNGIWHEALTTLADLRLVNTEDTMLKDNWSDLLQSVGLSDIASKPIVQCCTSEKAYPLQGIGRVKEKGRGARGEGPGARGELPRG